MVCPHQAAGVTGLEGKGCGTGGGGGLQSCGWLCILALPLPGLGQADDSQSPIPSSVKQAHREDGREHHLLKEICTAPGRWEALPASSPAQQL